MMMATITALAVVALGLGQVAYRERLADYSASSSFMNHLPGTSPHSLARGYLVIGLLFIAFGIGVFAEALISGA
jgi:hypothetical protein